MAKKQTRSKSCEIPSSRYDFGSKSAEERREHFKQLLSRFEPDKRGNGHAGEVTAKEAVSKAKAVTSIRVKDQRQRFSLDEGNYKLKNTAFTAKPVGKHKSA